MRVVEGILERLEGVRRSSKGWRACCPAHTDKNPSLSIAEGDDGRVLIRCHARCDFNEVIAALGLEPRDLFPAEASAQRKWWLP